MDIIKALKDMKGNPGKVYTVTNADNVNYKWSEMTESYMFRVRDGNNKWEIKGNNFTPLEVFQDWVEDIREDEECTHFKRLYYFDRETDGPNEIVSKCESCNEIIDEQCVEDIDESKNQVLLKVLFETIKEG